MYLTPEEQFWESLGTDGKALSVEKLREFALAREVSIDDIQYYISQRPFLEICNPDIPDEILNHYVKPKLIGARSLWIIQDRGERLTSGIGRFVYGPYYEGKALPDDEEDEGGEEGTLMKPAGTSVQQFVDTAIEMIEIAAARWSSVKIVGGYLSMQRAAWMAAETLGFAIDFVPNEHDLAIFDRVNANGGIKFRRGGDKQSTRHVPSR